MAATSIPIKEEGRKEGRNAAFEKLECSRIADLSLQYSHMAGATCQDVCCGGEWPGVTFSCADEMTE